MEKVINFSTWLLRRMRGKEAGAQCETPRSPKEWGVIFIEDEKMEILTIWKINSNGRPWSCSTSLLFSSLLYMFNFSSFSFFYSLLLLLLLHM